MENEFAGLYRGMVVDNADPTHNGRIKVKVYGVYDNVSKADLPWAVPCWPFRSHYVPDKDEIVYVMFSAGNPNYPVWMGWCPTKGENPSECQSGASERRMMVHKTLDGKKIYISDDENLIEIYHQDGSYIKMESDKMTLFFDDSNNIEIDASGVRVKGVRIDWN